jgi:DNA-3-methyladenine glycosylase
MTPDDFRKNRLPRKWFERDDVVKVAKELVGAYLCTDHPKEGLTVGRIVETEAYRGWGDKACHANEGKKTARNEIMFREGGHAYVYLCYGIHELFNVVTHRKDHPNAVLIRAIEPVFGVTTMVKRRYSPRAKESRLGAGPGLVTQCLGIDRKLNGVDMVDSPDLWIAKPNRPIPKNKIKAVPRVGVDYAGEDALLPWRVYLEDSPAVSRK